MRLIDKEYLFKPPISLRYGVQIIVNSLKTEKSEEAQTQSSKHSTARRGKA